MAEGVARSFSSLGPGKPFSHESFLWSPPAASRFGVFGTTLGLMMANAPVVRLGERIVRRVPIPLVHGLSAAIFLALGLAAIIGWE